MTGAGEKLKNYKARRVTARVLAYALLSLIAVVLIYPYVYMTVRSLMGFKQLVQSPVEYIPRPMSAEGWKNLAQGKQYLRGLWLTLRIVGFNIVAIPLAASFVAYGFAKCKFFYKDVLFAVMLATMMLPGAVTQLPVYMMMSKFEWLNTLYPLTLPNLLGGGAMNVFLFRQFMRGIPNTLDEAAKIDGAGSLRRYAQLTLPLCLPVIIFVLVGTFGAYWGDFYGPLVYISDPEKRTLAFVIFQDATYSYVTVESENVRMAAGVFMSTFPLLLFVAFQKYLIEGVTLSGVKG
ncbi:MAG: carbohydrate ABC transporter permease [Firmicutes bacterium]|nr:carbohydrate ABC transporter permease [Bacillota bacterium]